MSTIDERRERASAGVVQPADTDGWYGEFARPRVFLQPVAAPSVLGLCGITFSGMLGALAELNLGVVAVLGTLAAGSGLAAIGFLQGSHYIQHWAGWVFVISALLAWYVATAMMLKAAAGKTVLPLFKGDRAANVPGETPTRSIELKWGEPGVKMGQ